jgi:hypothetical protein
VNAIAHVLPTDLGRIATTQTRIANHVPPYPLVRPGRAYGRSRSCPARQVRCACGLVMSDVSCLLRPTEQGAHSIEKNADAVWRRDAWL